MPLPSRLAPSRQAAVGQGARALALLSLLLLTACATAQRPRRSPFKLSHSALEDNPARAPSMGNAQLANDVLLRAIALVGTPYRWGGNTPEGGFDCSGLVDYIYRNATHLLLPHSSRAMANLDRPTIRAAANLVSGDLVFFGARHGSIDHVGVYVGKGRFVHAPNSGGAVRLDNIDGPYWRDHFTYGKRLLD